MRGGSVVGRLGDGLTMMKKMCKALKMLLEMFSQSGLPQACTDTEVSSLCCCRIVEEERILSKLRNFLCPLA